MKAALLLLLAGCTADVCAPFSGQTCVALELHGDSFQPIDRLGITIEGVLTERFSPPDGPRQPPAHLPIVVAVLPGNVLAPFAIAVRAISLGFTRGQALSPLLAMGPGEHRSLVLDLLPPNTDGFGADGPDLLPVPDLRPGFDLQAFDAFDLNAFDLNAFDLSGSDLPDADLASDLPVSDLNSSSFCQGVTVGTLAGDGSFDFLDAQGTAARFNTPLALAVNDVGVLFVADYGNHRIRKIATDTTVTTLTGNGVAAFADGSGGASGSTSFNHPSGIAVDGANTAYVADFDNHRVRKIAFDGSTTTLAGNGTFGSQDGTGGAGGTTQFKSPYGIAISDVGVVFVADYNDHRIRQIAINGATSTLSGIGTPGFANGTSGTSQFNFPIGIAVDSAGSIVWVADSSNNRIRLVGFNGSSSTLAGSGTPGTTDGPADSAQFNGPIGVARDGTNNVYVLDPISSRIRRVAPDGSTITVTGSVGSGLQDGDGCTARFNNPQGIVGYGQLLFIADTGNSRIRVVHLPSGVPDL